MSWMTTAAVPDAKASFWFCAKVLYLSSFFPLFSRYIYTLCSDLPSIIQTTNSVLKDFQNDGVVYLELRTTPRAIPKENITKDDYTQTILNCISSFNASSHMRTNL